MNDTSLADAVERVAAHTVGIAMRRGSAAGIVWQPGTVVTSAAAVWRAQRLQLVLPGGEPVEGRVRGVDPTTDIAVISHGDGTASTGDAGDAAPAATAGDAAAAPGAGSADAGFRAAVRSDAAPRAGDLVFAVGREPSGLVHASFGRVGAAAGAWRTWRGGRIEQLIRLDGGLYGGLAGAPVADAAGRLIGIASPAFSREHAVVLPAVTVDRVLAQLLAHGRIAQGYAGIAAQPVRAQLDGRAVDGLLVSSVADDGPAAAAGLLVGDVIVAAGGEPLASLDVLRERLVVGQPLPIAVARGGQAVALTLQVGERAEPPHHHRHRGGCR